MKLNDDWKDLLKDCMTLDEKRSLFSRVENEYAKYKICPPRELVFNAFNQCCADNLKVVILGQDPYFNPGQAVGMSFSIDPTVKCDFPPSLRNIIKEVQDCYGVCAVENGDLTPWAKQGVLLLNTCLTVRQGQSLSHADLGWEVFTRAVISVLNKFDDIVFVLWGAHAGKYRELLTNPKNLILSSAHPSPLSASRGFIGCRHFQKINEFLTDRDKQPINW